MCLLLLFVVLLVWIGIWWSVSGLWFIGCSLLSSVLIVLGWVFLILLMKRMCGMFYLLSCCSIGLVSIVCLGVGLIMIMVMFVVISVFRLLVMKFVLFGMLISVKGLLR